MEEKPTRLLTELRAPEHRLSLMAFTLVAIVCSLVVATGIRFETVGSVLNPLPAWVFAVGQDLVVDEEPGLRAVQAGSELEPEESFNPAPTAEPEASPVPRTPATGTPASSGPREDRGPAGSAQGKGQGAEQGKGGTKGKGKGEDRGGKGGGPTGSGTAGPGNGNGSPNGNAAPNGQGQGQAKGQGQGKAKGHRSGKSTGGPDKISVSGGTGAAGPGQGAGQGRGHEHAPGQVKKKDGRGTPPGQAKGKGGSKRR